MDRRVQRAQIATITRRSSQTLSVVPVLLASIALTSLGGCGTLPVLFVGPRLQDDEKPRTVIIQGDKRPVPRPALAEGDAHKDSPSGRIRAVVEDVNEPPLEGPFTMEQLEQVALRHNPTLRQAVAEVEGEEGKAIQAGLYPNPKLGYAGINIGLPGGPMNTFGFIQQMFVSGGKLRLSRQKFLARASAAEFEVLTQTYQVVNGVRIQFLTVLGQQRRLAIQRERLKTAQDSLVTTQEMFNVGQANRVALHGAQARLQEQELNVLMAENTLRKNWEQLAAVVGKPLPPGRLEGELEVDLPTLDFDEQYQRILDESPRLGRAEALRKSEEIKVQRELVEPIPNLTVLAGGGRNMFAGENSRGFNTADVTAAIDVPVFDWNQGTVLQAKADFRRQQNEITRLELMFRRMLAEQFRVYLTALQHVRAFQTVVLPQLQEAYTVELKSYHEDRTTWPRVLAAQEALFLHRLMYIDHLVAWRTSHVAITGLLLVDGLTPPPTPEAPGHITATPKPR